MLIEKKPELKNSLSEKVILLTGAGGGIGLETAKAFAYMGAKVIIAEIDKTKGINAENTINELIGNDLVEFYEVDLSNENEINQMANYISEKYKCLDVIFNNATVVNIGAIDKLDTKFWDNSYAVNLKAPVILIQKFLPIMKKNNKGTIIFVSSSGAVAYMGAYEVFKASQVELSNTLAMELEDSNIYTYTIAPSLVKTETAMKAIESVSSKMGITTDEFYAMNSEHISDVESAGVGFALSVKKAGIYHNQEISSSKVLMDFNLLEDTMKEQTEFIIDTNTMKNIQKYISKIFLDYKEPYNDWKTMIVFKRQWVHRDFKKNMGMSVDQAYDKINDINNNIQAENYKIIQKEQTFLEKLKGYWKHQLDLLQAHETSRLKIEEGTKVLEEKISNVDRVLNI